MSRKPDEIKNAIINGQTVIGIELGSTRIKTVMIDSDNMPIASGNHDWENSYVDNIWTYSLEDIWCGIRKSYRNMADNIKKQYGVTVTKVKAIGISGMMHGYMVFDKNDMLLTPFRTWRNNITGQASEALTELFDYPIPQRWSIAHLYQAILNEEKHVQDIDFMTTLAGYIHWKLTGRKVLGIGEASGVFPIDLSTKDYSREMLDKFNSLISRKNLPWTLRDILPDVLVAGSEAGILTDEGARLLDETGELESGIPLCPPEGDAGTGMIATNSIVPRTGNVSAGTSVFAMIVLEKELSKAYPEIDLVTTPEGNLVAMVHSNNCTSDYDQWIKIFGEAIKALGVNVSKAELYDTLLGMALKGDADCGGLLGYGYISGEHITNFDKGCPMFMRLPGSRFNLANFMRTNLYTSLGALKIGLDILFNKESVQVEEMLGHGGFFKTREVGQKIMAACFGVPVAVMETAGEGGAWGIAVLASYMVNRAKDQSLKVYLNEKVFAENIKTVIKPDPEDVKEFNKFMESYIKGLAVERMAVETF